MNKRLFAALLCLFSYLISVGLVDAEAPGVDYGLWSEPQLAALIAGTRQLTDTGERIAALSRPFLATPYVANTLVGGPQTPERLIIDLAGVDCFTFLDQLESMRRAADLADLPAQLQRVRYRGGEVSYTNRRHFFSDWVADTDSVAVDVTTAVGQGRAETVVKQLNLRNDGALWLPGLPVVRRSISYIPASRIGPQLLADLHSGDYLGIYSEQAGLDVSHVGLVVREQGRLLLRHASSLERYRRVVDVDLAEYLRDKPGLVVYRVPEAGGQP